ncbi:MAG: hypothetical protein Q8P12_04105, partial [bacterium]|nr:hypothetical protein [bacterium]
GGDEEHPVGAAVIMCPPTGLPTAWGVSPALDAWLPPWHVYSAVRCNFLSWLALTPWSIEL